ncbi:hypothetical protein DL93DRAFT_2090442 [Clavulina sp. PMI_390]|nr:hypothetical protein DL93DRAFT_2090442 [Clavulina sp. PMI_390]
MPRCVLYWRCSCSSPPNLKASVAPCSSACNNSTQPRPTSKSCQCSSSAYPATSSAASFPKCKHRRESTWLTGTFQGSGRDPKPNATNDNARARAIPIACQGCSSAATALCICISFRPCITNPRSESSPVVPDPVVTQPTGIGTYILVDTSITT